MARLFNVEVFNQSISGSTATSPLYYSGTQFNALLGSAEKLKIQVIIDSIGPSVTTVTVVFEFNNAIQENTWATGAATGTVTVVASALTDLPKWGFMSLAAPYDLAAYGRLKVAADENATVRIIACGWSS